MKKLFILLLPLLFCTPLNAQRLIKYTTFFPTPYGSHENIVVDVDRKNEYVDGQNKIYVNGKEYTRSGNAYLNTGGSYSQQVVTESVPNLGNVFKYDGSLNSGTIVSGDLNIAKEGVQGAIMDIEGLLLVTKETASADFSNITIGNGPKDEINGQANFNGLVDGALARASGAANYTNIIGEVTLNKDNAQYSKLAECNGVVRVLPLRLKGTEECRYYLTCGYVTNMNWQDGQCGVPDVYCGKNSSNQHLCEVGNGYCIRSQSESRACSNVITNSIGTQYRYRYCQNNVGNIWGNWGEWTGTCSCPSGYELHGNACVKELTWNCTFQSHGGASSCQNNRFSPGDRCQPEGATDTFYDLISDTECDTLHCVCE